MTKINKQQESNGQVTTSCNISSTSSTSQLNTNNSPQRRDADSHDNNRGQDCDLRPKFAILKHKTEFLNQQSKYSQDLAKFKSRNNNNYTSDGRAPNYNNNNNTNQKREKATTPAWFFNIPTTRSPFPDFGSKLPASADDDDDDRQ